MIANKYKLLEVIGNGEFGSIYKAENIRTREMVALKKEPIHSNLKLLKNETRVYHYLNNCIGFPNVLWYGVDNDDYVMAIQLLGPSLRNIKEKHILPIPYETVLEIGIQMVKRLEILHNKGLIHRDIKPDNFLIGLNNEKKRIYLIDFGFCKKFILDNGSHILLRDNRPIIGTPNFISLNVHYGLEASRRDDLESVAYIMYYLMGYSDKMQNIIEFKKRLVRDTNNVISYFLLYCQTLRFEDKPDYLHLIQILSIQHPIKIINTKNS